MYWYYIYIANDLAHDVLVMALPHSRAKLKLWATGAVEGQISRADVCGSGAPSDINSWRRFVPGSLKRIIEGNYKTKSVQRWTVIWRWIWPTSALSSCVWCWSSRRYSCWCGPERPLESVWTVCCWSWSGKNFTAFTLIEMNLLTTATWKARCRHPEWAASKWHWHDVRACMDAYAEVIDMFGCCLVYCRLIFTFHHAFKSNYIVSIICNIFYFS